MGVLCFLVGAVLATQVLPRLYKQQEATVTVVKAFENIPEGTIITKSMLSTEVVGSYGLASDVHVDIDDVVGLVATGTIFKGEIMIPQRLMTEEAYKELQNNTTVELLPGQSLVSVKLPSTSAGLAGLLRSGDLVTVFEVIEREREVEVEVGEEGEGKEEDALPSVSTENTSIEKYKKAVKILSGMRVYEVRNAELESVDVLEKKEEAAVEAEEEVDLDYVPVYVVFCCTEEQAAELIRLDAEGTLHLILEQEVEGD